MQGLAEGCLVHLDALEILRVAFVEIGEQIEADAVQVHFQLCGLFHSGLVLLQGVINGRVQLAGQSPCCHAYDQRSEQQQAIGEHQLQSETHLAATVVVALFMTNIIII